MEPDTRPLTRADLAQFFRRADGTPDLRAIIAFENALRDILAQAAAINNGPFVITVADAGLPGAKVLTGSANIEINDTTDVVLDLTDTAVTADTYGAATMTVSFTVDDKGRMTSAAEVALDFANIAGLAGVAQGGTDIASYTTGDFIYASDANTLAKLANVAVGNVLLSGGVGAASAWGKVSASHVTGATGTGDFVLATSPALVTPDLGTPSAAVLTNATGLPLTTGVADILPEANGGTGTASAGFNGGPAVYTTFTFVNGKCTAAS